VTTLRLGYLLKHAQLRYLELQAVAMEPYGITGRQCAVLIAIDDQKPRSQQEVAESLGVDRTTMVALVDELEAKALVDRRPDPDDRRKNVVALTDLGRETLAGGLTATAATDEEFFAGLSADDAATFRRLLAAVVRSS
jgi:DNA-binding MarR family transcriptional regulator